MNRWNRLSLAWILLLAHLGALIFGLVGLLIMLPHPELWSSDPNALRVFDWSMAHAGATHILFGALAVGAFGIVALGARRTALFALISISFSLSFELFGTGTGWPFGNYEYTDFLGTKILGRVPWTIPLSWFSMGLSSFLLGSWLAQRLGLRNRGAWSVFLGAWMLTAWDLVLDPAMAHHSLRVQFWIWHEQGPYFGMPIKNFAGWALTGLVFMAVSRWLWREDIDLSPQTVRFPAILYGANLVFAMVISAAVGLWQPILIAALVAVAPWAVPRVARVSISRPARQAANR